MLDTLRGQLFVGWESMLPAQASVDEGGECTARLMMEAGEEDEGSLRGPSERIQGGAAVFRKVARFSPPLQR